MRLARALLAIVVAGVVALLLVPGGVGASGTGASEASVRPSATSTVTLTPNASAVDVSPTFFGTTVSARAPLFGNESALVQATPARVVLWPGANAGDDYDPFNNTLWANNNSYVTAQTNETQFVAWCKSIGCTAIFEVPGVIDNPTVAAQIVRETEVNLSFHPAYWEIGNEPGFWLHWGQMWGQWTSYTQGPTSLQYAEEVSQYITAMRTVDPTIRLIGLPGLGRVSSSSLQQWIDDTIGVDGPNLSAIGVHIYPDPSPYPNSLDGYFHTLNATDIGQSIPGRVPRLLSIIQNAIVNSPSCQLLGCGSIPLFFTEIGSAISGRPDALNFSEGFAGGLYIAAEITQAIALNITNVDAYATVLGTANAWFDQSGNPHPEYTVYSDVLSHLGPVAYTVNVTSSSPAVSGNVYSTATRDPAHDNRNDLLVVNTNVGTNISFAPSMPGYTPGAPAVAWCWNGTAVTTPYGANVVASTPAPVPWFFPSGLPSTWVLSADSLVVLESYPGGGAPVRLTETGLPIGTRWFVGAGPFLGTSTAPTITLFLPSGSYVTVPGPALGVPHHLATERWTPPAAASFSVGSTAVDVSVPYVLQYSLTLATRPLGAGSLVPGTGWVNAGADISVMATAASGFSLRAWEGWGPGSFNGSGDPAVVRALGPILETAIFDPGYTVGFTENGLPAGTTWSVVIRGTTIQGSTPTLTDVEANGTYKYQVPPLPGFAAHPATSSVVVRGIATFVTVTFSRVAFAYPITWLESGLPVGTAWSVTVRNSTVYSVGPSLSTTEPNGTYTYVLGTLPGYRADPPRGGITVGGGPLVVQVSWTVLPGALYPVVFVVTDPVVGAPWSVSLAGQQGTSLNATLGLDCANGTWHFVVTAPSGHYASPGGGTVVVQGAPVRIALAFNASAGGGGRSSASLLNPPSAWTEIGRALGVTAVMAITGLGTFLLFNRPGRGRPAPTVPPGTHPWDQPATPPHAAPESVDSPAPR